VENSPNLPPFSVTHAGVLEDGEAAEEIKRLKNLRPAVDSLRSQLYLIVSKRFEKLKSELRG
jgi:hypothetical protein